MEVSIKQTIPLPPPPETYTIEKLTKNECQILMEILCRLGGNYPGVSDLSTTLLSKFRLILLDRPKNIKVTTSDTNCIYLDKGK